MTTLRSIRAVGVCAVTLLLFVWIGWSSAVSGEEQSSPQLDATNRAANSIPMVSDLLPDSLALELKMRGADRPIGELPEALQAQLRGEALTHTDVLDLFGAEPVVATEAVTLEAMPHDCLVAAATTTVRYHEGDERGLIPLRIGDPVLATDEIVSGLVVNLGDMALAMVSDNVAVSLPPGAFLQVTPLVCSRSASATCSPGTRSACCWASGGCVYARCFECDIDDCDVCDAGGSGALACSASVR